MHVYLALSPLVTHTHASRRWHIVSSVSSPFASPPVALTSAWNVATSGRSLPVFHMPDWSTLIAEEHPAAAAVITSAELSGEYTQYPRQFLFSPQNVALQRCNLTGFARWSVALRLSGTIIK